ncbi:MAG TPA: tetratricopeptide repeat protein [Candidatus Acidoferrum sp.]|nr:tetratricopeptide repeat protein [Candidatus Acidoferrum sp.]
MTRYFLAIPGIALLLFCLHLPPALAQTTPDTPGPSPSSSATPAPVSQEDMAKLYLIRKEYPAAEVLFRKLTQQQPKNAVYWNELGITLHNQAELDPAMKCYEKASKLDSHYADPVNNIGTVWYERKKYSKAIRAYKRAISIKDDFASFYMNLGYAYFADKKYEDAIASFHKTLALDPQAFDQASSRTGTIVQDRSISEDRGRFYFMLAKSFAQAGNLERCIIYLRKARDEGYKNMDAAKSDPDFAGVLKDPAIQEILFPAPPQTAQP